MHFAWKWKTAEEEEEEDRKDELKDKVERALFLVQQAQQQLNEIQKELNK
jgi:hypothetical protein